MKFYIQKCTSNSQRDIRPIYINDSFAPSSFNSFGEKIILELEIASGSYNEMVEENKDVREALIIHLKNIINKLEQ